MTGGGLVAAQQLQRAGFLGGSGGGAGGVAVVAHEIQRLEPRQFAGLFQRLKRGLEMCEVDAVRLHANAAPMQAVALHDAEVHKIRGVLDQHDVARVKKNFREDVEQLLRAVGYHHAAGRVRLGLDRLAIELRETASSECAQRFIAGGGAVLQRRLAGFAGAQHGGHDRTRLGHRQRGIICESRCQRNQPRPHQSLPHQPSNRRLGRASSQL